MILTPTFFLDRNIVVDNDPRRKKYLKKWIVFFYPKKEKTEAFNEVKYALPHS